MGRHSSNPKHNLVLDLYASEQVPPKEIARRANTTLTNVHAIVSRARRHEDRRAFARKDPLAFVSPRAMRRLKKYAERYQTTPFGIATAVIEMVADDDDLLMEVITRVYRIGRK